MKLRNVGLVVAVLAAAVSCDRGQDRTTSTVAPVAQGSSTDPWNAPEPAKQPIERPLFWKLEKDGRTSYVLGTMHLGIDPETLPPIVWKQLDAAPAFAMEVDPAQLTNLDLTRKDGKTLRDELGEDYWKKLEDAMGPALAKTMLEMKPMIPVTMLAMRGLPPTASMDRTLHTRAVNAKKKLVYLETVKHQLSALEQVMDARSLKDLLDDLNGAHERTKAMVAAYQAGDGDQLVAIMATERELWLKKGRSAAEYDEGIDALLYKRNASWIEPIEQLHAEGGGFITFGAAHAVGPRGVLDLLAKRGFTVTRLVP